MAKPFANSPRHLDEILDSYIFGIQTGNTVGDSGLSEMKHITVKQLKDYMAAYLPSAFNIRDDCDTHTPENPAVNDIFLCIGTFEEDGIIYLEGHVYAYSIDNKWNDFTRAVKPQEMECMSAEETLAILDE